MKKIVFDMDGVLANFNDEINGIDRFDKEIGFFANLKPLYENYKIVSKLVDLGVNVYILSASPNKQADKDKRQWLKNYIPNLKKNHIVFCRNGENKADFIKDIKKSLLVDDYSFNLINWHSVGGQCLKYNNGYNCIKNLHKNYNIKTLLNFNNLLDIVSF